MKEIVLPKFMIDMIKKGDGGIHYPKTKCPKCKSIKVGVLIESDELRNLKEDYPNGYIGCVTITSGKQAFVCQDCSHKWDEKEIFQPTRVNFG